MSSKEEITDLLDRLIDNEISFDSMLYYEPFMMKLTEFVDGLVVKTDTYMEHKDPADLTSLEVVFFPYSDLENALAFSYAVGIDNSIILLQQYQPCPGIVEFEDLDETEKSTDFEEQEPNGFLVVFRDLPELNEELLVNRMNTADISAVIAYRSNDSPI